MKITELKTKWWYRLLKVIFYFFYITFLIFGIVLFPIVILIFELLRGSFFYIVTGDWNFQIERKKKTIKNIYTKILNFIQGDNNLIGINRTIFNIIFFLIVIPGYGITLNYLDIDATIGIIGFIAIALIHITISFYRFHNLGKSGWNSLAFIIPFYNIYLFFILILKPGIKNINEKLKKEKLWNIFTIIILSLILVFFQNIRSFI